jgi:HlyD family secretion protein
VAGVVSEQIREVGELAVPGTPLLVLADPRSALLTVYVAEPLLPAVRLDGELLVVLDGRRDKPYRGTVTRIADQAEFTPSTVQTAEERARLVFAVTLRLDNRAEELKAGMPADVFLSRSAAK